jgi:uncharacterized protein (DUF433 family)
MGGSSVSEQELIARWMEPHPHRAGAAEWRLKEYGPAVWALVGHWYGVERDAAQVAHDYQVPLEAINAALAYYRRNRAAIDTRLEENAAAFSRS